MHVCSIYISIQYIISTTNVHVFAEQLKLNHIETGFKKIWENHWQNQWEKNPMGKTQWENHGTFWVKWLGSNLMPRPRRVMGWTPTDPPKRRGSWTWNPIHIGKTHLNHPPEFPWLWIQNLDFPGSHQTSFSLQVVMEERNASWDSSLTCACLRFLCFIACLLLLFFLRLLIWFLCSLHKYYSNCLVSFANITILPT